MRVVSLLPAATEIVAALGLQSWLVGVSHECDHPPGVAALPRVTVCPIHQAPLSSREIDQRVREALASGQSLYVIDEVLLRDLRPDVILTQRLCDVCAVGHGSVAALAETLPGPPRVVSLEPMTLADVLADVERVAEALGVLQRGIELHRALRGRIDAVAGRTGSAAGRPRCFLMEWAEPPFCAGHWNPELVALAGGREVLGSPGQPSRAVSWDEIAAAAPEVVVLACCGFTEARARQDLPLLEARPEWKELPAVAAGRVHMVDATAHFSRPGPRLVDSLELLAALLHPERFPRME